MNRLASILLLVCFLFCASFHSQNSLAKNISEADLKKVETQAKQQSLEHEKLQKQASQINKELAQINKKLISTARSIQDSEDKLSRMEKLLETLKKDLEKSSSSFAKENSNLVKTLSSLQNLALKPTESLLVQPLSPVDIIRSAIILRETIPYLEENANLIRQHFTNLKNQKNKIEMQIIEIEKQKRYLQNKHSQMKTLVKNKSHLKNKVEIQSAQAQKNMNKLVNQAKDLRDLLQKIEKQRREQEAKKIAEKRKLEEKQSIDLIKSQQPSINNITKGFLSAKGNLPLPARGSIISQYGDQKNKGVTSKGITLATRSFAQVIAPFDGTVVFAGPFRGYGEMIIVEHDGGYLSLLAGLGSINVETGQLLLAGEPIGQMPDTQKAELYIEIRKNNQPINPTAWFKI